MTLMTTTNTTLTKERTPATREYASARYAANREKMLEQKSAYRARNRDAVNARQRAFYAANREKLKEYYMAHREANRERNREYARADRYKKRARNLRNNYGLSPEEYEDMYLALGGHCQICDAHKDILVVDHDHDTGEVRGLLCHKCNASIGMLRDSLELLTRAADYVRTGSL